MNPKNDVVGQDEKLKIHASSKIVFIYQTSLALLGSIVLLIVIGLGMAVAEKIPEETNQKFKDLRIPFILNQGQMDRQVGFYAKTFSGTVYVTNQGKMVYELPTGKDRKNQKWVLIEEVLGRLPVKEIKGEKESETKVSFFQGNDPAKWKSGLTTYETVNLGEVYKGIKLKLRAYGGSVEKLYYLSPGREAKEIRIKVHGAESLRVNDQGELEAQTGNGPVVFSRPKAFQQAGIKREDVEVAYVVDRDRYGFKVGSYDKSKELIIDPLIQSTYLGGNGEDLASFRSMAVSGGNVYVAGGTSSTNFPSTSGGVQPGYSGGKQDAFVSLLSADLKHIVQSTYLGGNNDDWVVSMAVSGGNVYVAGGTYSTNFPSTSGGAQPGYGGGPSEAFVSLLSADLKQLIQSTYLGGNGFIDEARSMAVSGGSVYVTGQTGSTNFPGTSGGAQPGYGGGTTDVFVSLLSADLKQLVQSTYLGGNGLDSSYPSMAVSGGNVYVAGTTGSRNFPRTSGGSQPGYGGGVYDTFVSVLSTDLKQLIQSTYLGGNGDDYGCSMTVSGGNVYVAGVTGSTNFPGTTGGAQPGYGGGGDAFVSVLSTDLKQLVQSTYLGGNGEDAAYSMAVSGGNVYVAGSTNSINFPGTSGGAQPGYGGGSYDGFVALLSADLQAVITPTSTTTITTVAPSSGGSGGGGGGGCFIVTAAFGSPMDPHVQILRDFRDNYLLENWLGQWLVKFYYQASPPIAEMIAKNESLRLLTRWFLSPIIGIAYLTVNFGTATMILIVGFIFLILVSSIRFVKKSV